MTEVIDTIAGVQREKRWAVYLHAPDQQLIEVLAETKEEAKMLAEQGAANLRPYWQIDTVEEVKS